jgi:hypothetical protein
MKTLKQEEVDSRTYRDAHHARSAPSSRRSIIASDYTPHRRSSSTMPQSPTVAPLISVISSRTV